MPCADLRKDRELNRIEQQPPSQLCTVPRWQSKFLLLVPSRHGKYALYDSAEEKWRSAARLQRHFNTDLIQLTQVQAVLRKRLILGLFYCLAQATSLTHCDGDRGSLARKHESGGTATSPIPRSNLNRSVVCISCCLSSRPTEKRRGGVVAQFATALELWARETRVSSRRSASTDWYQLDRPR